MQVVAMVGEYYKQEGLIFSEGMERNGIQARRGSSPLATLAALIRVFVFPGLFLCTCPHPLPPRSDNTHDRSIDRVRAELLVICALLRGFVNRTGNLEASAVLLFSLGLDKLIFDYLGLC